MLAALSLQRQVFPVLFQAKLFIRQALYKYIFFISIADQNETSTVKNQFHLSCYELFVGLQLSEKNVSRSTSLRASFERVLKNSHAEIRILL